MPSSAKRWLACSDSEDWTNQIRRVTAKILKYARKVSAQRICCLPIQGSVPHSAVCPTDVGSLQVVVGAKMLSKQNLAQHTERLLSVQRRSDFRQWLVKGLRQCAGPGGGEERNPVHRLGGLQILRPWPGGVTDGRWRRPATSAAPAAVPGPRTGWPAGVAPE